MTRLSEDLSAIGLTNGYDRWLRSRGAAGLGAA